MLSSLNMQRFSISKCKRGLQSLTLARNHLFYQSDLIFVKPLCVSYCKINSGTEDKQNPVSTRSTIDGNGQEDFFGIPPNFKLQHATIPKNDSCKTHLDSSIIKYQRLQGATSCENQASKPDHQGHKSDTKNNASVDYSISERYISRRERRRKDTVDRLGTLGTNFGYISIDEKDPTTGCMSLSEKNALAERLWTNMANENVSFKSKTKSNQNVVEKDISHENPLFPHRDKHTIEHGSTPSSLESSNYFDEMYFQSFAEFTPPVKNQRKADFPPHESYWHERKAGDHDHKQMETQKRQSSECDINVNSVLSEDEFSNHSIFENSVSEQCTLNENEMRTNSDNNINKMSSDNSENLNFIDEHYFGNSVSSSKNLEKVPNENTDGDTDMNFIDSQYFTVGKSENDLTSVGNEICDNSTFEHIVGQYTQGKEIPQSLPHVEDVSSVARYADEQEESSTAKTDSDANLISITTNKKFLQQLSSQQQAVKSRTSSDKSESAYDVAMRIRRQIKSNSTEKKTHDTPVDADPQMNDGLERGKYKLDSKGFRILSDQVQDLRKMTSADVVTLLRKKIIFDHEDFLALDKPYGLPSFAQPGERLSLTNLLPALCASLPLSYKSNELHLVHGLDRDVTGAVILAKSPEIGFILRGMFDNNEIIQRFWAVTKGVPQPKAGTIDIPIGEGKIGNICKMVLRPQYSRVPKYIARTSKAPSQQAITEYKVLGSYQQAALVECELHTNRVKHQIRLHMASGLNTPILGDHKYSHFSKLAPQKLHPDMLKLLKVRQAKVRHIALHLHCRSVVLTNYKGRMIFLTTRPPLFFKDNLRSLKIPMPK